MNAAAKVPAGPLTPMTLDSSAAIKLTLGKQMQEERALMLRNDVWHRIKILRGRRCDKEVLLRSILRTVEPATLIPVKYQVNGDDAYFMARNCGTALHKLCRSSLIIKLPNDEAVAIIVTLGFASILDLKINIQPVLLAALIKRYTPVQKHLRLDNFHRDETISKTVYCPLTQNKTLDHTLQLAHTSLGPFEHLSLRDNDLSNLKVLANTMFSGVRSLDLRRNALLRMDELTALKNMTNLQEIWLDENPLCENYATARRYVDSVKLYCPNLRKIDGISLDLPEYPLSQLIYRRSECSNAKRIVEQFLAHFFRLYDGKDRSRLSGIYRENSLFTCTLGDMSEALKKQKFGALLPDHCYNTLDYSGRPFFRLGAQDIISVFTRMPETVHDLKNISIDIMLEEYQKILFCVEGLFRIPKTSSLMVFTYSRTFYLVARADNEYNVLNDQCYIAPATTIIHEIPDAANDEEIPLEEFSPREKEQMVRELAEITTMNGEWSQRYLNDANWDKRKAITHFMDNYNSSGIPVEAFSKL